MTAAREMTISKMAQEKCIVCGRDLDPAHAYRRIKAGVDIYLVCCPMCLAALEAGEMQRRMMPDSFSDDRIDVLVEYLPAVQIGGDYAFIDWIAPDKLYLVVADVAGHGISSSLIMNRISTELDRKLRGQDISLAAMATDLNEWMRSRLGDVRHYATAFFGLVDFTDKTLTYLNCGHPPQLIWSSRERSYQRLESQTTPLGLLPNQIFGNPEPISTLLNDGDKLVLFTDGLTDAMGGDDVEAGIGGVMTRLRESAEEPDMRSAQDLANHIRKLGHDARPDDVLFVFADVRRTGVAGE